jgi:hypothetical protein
MLAQGIDDLAANRMASERRLAVEFKRKTRDESDVSNKTTIRARGDDCLGHTSRSTKRFCRARKGEAPL